MLEPTAKANRAALLLLALAGLSLFWPALLEPATVLFPTFSPFTDTLVIHWPKARLMAETWQADHGLPHWTPLILSGMPLAANQLAMLSYPPAWLFLFFPLAPVFNLLFVFHLLLGGVGVYLLLREKHDLSPGAALLGGLTFALNGKWLAHAAGGHVSMVGAFGWLPWGVLGLLIWFKRAGQRPTEAPRPGDFGWLLLAAVALAMQLVTHTLPLLYSAYLLAALTLWQLLVVSRTALFQRPVRFTLGWLLPLGLVPGLAILLGAGQLLPLLELVEFSNRALTLAQATEYSVTPAQLLIGLFLPTGQGGHELVIYLGLIPLLLAPLGLTYRRRWSWFYGGLLLFTVLFALGPATPLHALFYGWAPGFGWVRTPARIFFVGALAIAALTGFGVERLMTGRWPAGSQAWLTRLGVGLGFMALLLGLGLAFGFGQMGRAALGLALLPPLGIGLILLRMQGLLSANRALWGLGLLLFLDLASFGWTLIRFVPQAEALEPGRAAAEYLAQKPGPFRVYSPSYSLPLQTAAEHNLQLADGVEPVHLAVYDRFMAQAGGYQDASFSVTIPPFGDEPLASALQDVSPNVRLLGLLNVTHLASEFPLDDPQLSLERQIEGTYIYANRQALPRAWVVHRTIPAEPDWLAQLEALPNLAGVATVAQGPYLTGPAQPSPVTVTAYQPDRIGLETEIDAPGWLALSEIWYPGWQATVNGTTQPMQRVDGLLRGLSLPRPGAYQIEMVYRPRSVVWGNRLAGLGLALVVVGGGLIWLRGQRRFRPDQQRNDHPK